MNLGKTYAKLRIFPKIFRKSGPRFVTATDKSCWSGVDVCTATLVQGTRC